MAARTPPHPAEDVNAWPLACLCGASSLPYRKWEREPPITSRLAKPSGAQAQVGVRTREACQQDQRGEPTALGAGRTRLHTAVHLCSLKTPEQRAAPAGGPTAQRGGCVSEDPAAPAGKPEVLRRQSTHLIHHGAAEVQAGKGGVVVVRHVHPAAEEDDGTGLTGQGPQVHFNVGFLLGTEDGSLAGGPAQQAPKPPSQPSLELWVPPAHRSLEGKTALQHQLL